MDPYSAVPEIRRLRWLVRFAVLWSAIIVGRLMYLQGFKSEELGRVADSQQLREQEIRAPRGTITDRNGEQLAVSVPVDSLAVNPKKIKDVAQAVQQLSRILNMDVKELNGVIGEAKQAKRGFVWVKRKITPPENSCRPAVDVLFRSVAENYGSNTLAAVLTGMGQDGQRGCEFIRAAGGFVLAQDEASSVVWGMPGAVVQAGLASSVLPLPQIAGEFVRLANLGRNSSAPRPLVPATV